MANFSLGEIDALTRKATRGAGYSWGIAEEVGKAIRWLSAYGFYGPEVLAQHLSISADKHQDLMPNLIDETSEVIVFENQNSQSNLCALSCNALMNDLGHRVNANSVLSFNNMLFALLALPAAGRIAEAYGISVSFSFADKSIICDPVGIAIKDTPPLFANFAIEHNSNVICKREHSKTQNTHFPSPESRAVTKDVLDILEGFAHKTYAPDTEESRMRGAGES